MTEAVSEVSEVTALVPSAPFSMDTYLAGVATDSALHAQQQLVIAYDRAVRALVGPNDVQKSQGKEFKKKSAWRKLARYFSISTAIVREESHRDAENHLVSTVVVRAIAPWGQFAEAIAKCSTREARFRNDVSKADHDCPATAQTRATNRAIADLIAAGEVSAEEIEFGEMPTAQPQRTAPPPSAAATAGPASVTPSDKQVSYFKTLLDSPVFTAEEKKRGTEWLANKATRQTMKGQIDWLKTQTETRKGQPTAAIAQAAAIVSDIDSFAEMPAGLNEDADELPF